jgi:hypothetical protein
MSPIATNTGLAWAFIVMACVLVALLTIGIFLAWTRTGATTRSATEAAAISAIASSLWLSVTYTASSQGLLRFDSAPPTMTLAFVAMTAIAVGLGVSAVGRRLADGLPLAMLVGVQAFRLPLELMLHRAYETGLMPEQMSYSGLNFDILTGISALAVSLLLASGLAGARISKSWNVLGSLLLLNVVVISLVSAPTPIRVFENSPPNVWITRPPYIWLPTVMVAFAILGHIVVYRALRSQSAGQRA